MSRAPVLEQQQHGIFHRCGQACALNVLIGLPRHQDAGAMRADDGERGCGAALMAITPASSMLRKEETMMAVSAEGEGEGEGEVRAREGRVCERKGKNCNNLEHLALGGIFLQRHYMFRRRRGMAAHTWRCREQGKRSVRLSRQRCRGIEPGLFSPPPAASFLPPRLPPQDLHWMQRCTSRAPFKIATGRRFRLVAAGCRSVCV